MFYLAEIKDNSVKIVSSCPSKLYKPIVLTQYLQEHNIIYIDKIENVQKEGLYCIIDGEFKYKIFSCNVINDGYIFNGYVESNEEYCLEFVYYVCDELKKYYICRELKGEC